MKTYLGILSFICQPCIPTLPSTRPCICLSVFCNILRMQGKSPREHGTQLCTLGAAGPSVSSPQSERLGHCGADCLPAFCGVTGERRNDSFPGRGLRAVSQALRWELESQPGERGHWVTGPQSSQLSKPIQELRNYQKNTEAYWNKSYSILLLTPQWRGVGDGTNTSSLQTEWRKT